MFFHLGLIEYKASNMTKKRQGKSSMGSLATQYRDPITFVIVAEAIGIYIISTSKCIRIW